MYYQHNAESEIGFDLLTICRQEAIGSECRASTGHSCYRGRKKVSLYVQYSETLWQQKQ